MSTMMSSCPWNVRAQRRLFLDRRGLPPRRSLQAARSSSKSLLHSQRCESRHARALTSRSSAAWRSLAPEPHRVGHETDPRALHGRLKVVDGARRRLRRNGVGSPRGSVAYRLNVQELRRKAARRRRPRCMNTFSAVLVIAVAGRADRLPSTPGRPHEADAFAEALDEVADALIR